MDGSRNPRRKRIYCRSVWLRRNRAKTDHHGSRVSLATTAVPTCQQGDISEGAQQNTTPPIELDKLPEDILRHIHSLLPLRDAARAARVSHRFLRSWRCFPYLTFSMDTLGLNVSEGTTYERAKRLVDRIDHVIQNHSGIGLKTIKLAVCLCHNVITAGRLDNWLQAAVKSGIVDISVELSEVHRPKFNFSCSLLSCAGNSLRSISLLSCTFRPASGIGCLKSLKSVCLKFVHITGEELGCLLSSAVSLEELGVSYCDEITFLDIPSHLLHLSIVKVFMCKRLQMIQIYAPKLTAFFFEGPPMEIFFSDSSQLKYMIMHGIFRPGMIQHARTRLLSTAPNLQSLVLSSFIYIHHSVIFSFNLKLLIFILEHICISFSCQYTNAAWQIRPPQALEYSICWH